ncbi:hypothetical protein PCANC_20470 [Puccinia coronata f. sp. avenae]|uniref:Uncharacterized protein n=1 Tax=Puccinia coronata f. sp. avenae TaxID=200324 RepID=A0A2N5UGE5_9BASI|nr:hypothetical protein PCANC_20470 [Puccinia coronata f. sp. avenae]PLW36790.1 hypothetical protein PCASD_13235 [Puccinia coronata f. sp. avenae]
MKTSQHDGQEHFRQSNQGRANEALGRLNQNSSTTLTDAVNLAGNVVERKKWRSNRKSSDDDADGQEGGGSQSGRPSARRSQSTTTHDQSRPLSHIKRVTASTKDNTTQVWIEALWS